MHVIVVCIMQVHVDNIMNTVSLLSSMGPSPQELKLHKLANPVSKCLKHFIKVLIAQMLCL